MDSHTTKSHTSSKNRRFTSLAHHVTKEWVWENLNQIPAKSAAEVDGQTATEAKESFEEWIAGMLQSVHREGYKRQIYGVSISRSPESRRCAPSGCRLSLTGHSSEAPHRSYLPSTSRIFYPAHSVDVRGGVPTKRSQRSMRELRAVRSSGCWRRTSRTFSVA